MNMKKNSNFETRVLDAIVSVDGNRLNQGRILRMAKRLKAVESVTYTEWELRGLSKREKEFMRENGMKCYVDLWQEGYKWNYKKGNRKNRYYIFIKRDLTTGKPRLYAMHKEQWIQPNRHTVGNGWDYEFWLTVDLHNGCDICRFNYEHRFGRFLWPVAIS